MSDKQIFLAYILDENEFGTQLLKYEFEFPIVEFWGEPEEQKRLKDYFELNHYTRKRPIAIEASEVIDYMPYVRASGGVLPTDIANEVSNV